MRIISKFLNLLSVPIVALAAVAVPGLVMAPTQSQAQTSPCIGTYLFCDDFNGAVIDTTRWTKANLNIASQYPVRPGNLSRTTVNDNGTTITVVEAKIFGDLNANPRRGGVIITKAQFGGGRYEARMKNVPGPHGCSCMWNYYDSLNEASPPPVRVYTEIDIEMPAHLASPPVWSTWRKTLGLNTWADSDDDAHATYLNPVSGINPFDAQFHVYRWDWRDGTNGTRKIDWYIDNVLQGSTTQHVGTHPAQLWLGVWPAPWNGMDWNFNSKSMYIDWVRISALP